MVRAQVRKAQRKELHLFYAEPKICGAVATGYFVLVMHILNYDVRYRLLAVGHSGHFIILVSAYLPKLQVMWIEALCTGYT